MTQKLFHAVFLVSFFFCLSIAQAGPCWEGTVEKVIDGDTLAISRQGKGRIIHLDGIDAPEEGQPFARESQSHLQAMLLNKNVRVCPQKTPGSSAAEVLIVSGYSKSVNREAVRLGFAWSTARRYENLERLARKKRLGLWAGTDPVRPDMYRAMLSKKSERQSEQVLQDARMDFEASFYEDYYAGVRYTTPEETPRAPAQKSGGDDTAGKRPGLEHADLVTMQTLLKRGGDDYDGSIRVRFSYVNKQNGEAIHWSRGAAGCDCKVVGRFTSGNQSTIARTHTTLNSSTQQVYIEIPERHFTDTTMKLLYGRVECTIDTGTEELRAMDTF